VRLKANGIHHFFDIIRGYQPASGTFTKRPHLHEILSFYEARYRLVDVVFYDDLTEVLYELKSIGVACKLVDWKTGTRLSDLVLAHPVTGEGKCKPSIACTNRPA
jgi:hypothetical protein